MEGSSGINSREVKYDKIKGHRGDQTVEDKNRRKGKKAGIDTKRQRKAKGKVRGRS